MDEKIQNILLMGGTFSKNKGDQAMKSTAIRRFHRMYPGCTLTVATYAKKETVPFGKNSIEADDAAGKPIAFELIRNQKKLSHPFKVLLWRFLPFSGIRNALMKGERYLRTFLEADLVFDMSGFAMSDSRPLWRRLVFCFEIFTGWCFDKPFVIFTQGLGPFKKMASRVCVRLFFPMVKIIIPRGEMSYRHLSNLGIHKKTQVHICSDCAFLFRPAPGEIDEGRKVLDGHALSGKSLFGIVPNINIYQRTSPKGRDNPYIKLLADLCNYVHTSLHGKVVFICFERYEGRTDDMWLIEQIVKSADHPEDIIVLDPDYSYGVLKTIIGRMDFIVTSRYHALIASISEETPFFVIGWAHKYGEMGEDVGLSRYVYDLKDLSDRKMIEFIGEAWLQRGDIRTQLHTVNEKLRASAGEAFDLVREKWPPQ